MSHTALAGSAAGSAAKAATRVVADEGGPLTPDDGIPRADLRALLNKRGLRCTTQRVAILRLLEAGDATGQHLSAAMIHERLVNSGHGADVATVYRTLITLTEVGLIHSVTVRDQANVYGLATEAHHHALCQRCGHVHEIAAEHLRSALTQASLVSDYGLDDTSITLSGVCPQCR